MNVLAFGEILFDVFPNEKCIGGAPLNFCAHFVKLGGRASVLSSVGNDSLGREALQYIKKLNVGTEHIAVSDDKITGRCNVTLDKNSIPRYDLFDDVAYDYIKVDENTANGFDTLYFGTLALRNGHNKKAIKSLLEYGDFKNVFCDVNIRPPFYSAESINIALDNATILKISDEELPLMLKAINIDALPDIVECAMQIAKSRAQIKTVIITCGGEGAFVFDKKSGEIIKCSSKKVEPVSTVGAGDSFSAAFLYKYLSGEKIDSALEFASRVAAFVVSSQGAIPEYNINEL